MRKDGVRQRVVGAAVWVAVAMLALTALGGALWLGLQVPRALLESLLWIVALGTVAA